MLCNKIHYAATIYVNDLISYLLCSFNAKNLCKCREVNISVFTWIAPYPGGCFPTAFTIVTDHFTIFNSNPVPATTSATASSYFFFISFFFLTDTEDSRDPRKGRVPSLFFTSNSTLPRKFRYLFASLHLRSQPRVFLHSAGNYQTVSR